MGYWESSGKSDEWYTPQYVFDAMGVTFDTDAAAPVDRTFCTVPALNFVTEKSLEQGWNGFTWLNPPFGGRNSIMNWIVSMKHHGNGVILTPDRTSAAWWQYACKTSDAQLFVYGKIRFVRPDGSIGKSPSNGTNAICLWGTRCSGTFERAV